MDQTYKGKVYIFIRERKHLEYTDEAGTPWCVCVQIQVLLIWRVFLHILGNYIHKKNI